MKRKYNYFYKITNLLNDHYYYGIHSTNNLDDGYMGSGSRLQIAYKKYGLENFKKEILKFFDTRKEALEHEAQIVNEILIESKDCYNIIKGGQGDSSEEHICKLNDQSFKKDTIMVKLKGTDKFFTINKNDIDDINKYDFTWNGRHHSEESKEKIRKAMTPINSNNPNIWISKLGKKKYIKKTLLKQYLEDGWQIGRIKYMGESHSGNCG